LWGRQLGAKYRLAKVERSAITAQVSATGTLNPVIMVQVGTQVSGMIEKLFADFNSTVVPGQQLAQLDQASFRAKVMQAEANLDNARAEVRNAMANVLNVRASIATARADMASRSAQRERARVAIVDTKRVLERQNVLKIPKAALRFQPQLTPQEREQFITAFQKQQMASVSNGLGLAPRKSWQITPKVWTLTPEGALWPITVRLGINDEQFSELQDGNLQEGQELIIGLNGNDGHGASGVPPSSTSRPPSVRF
jgi:hypothetical protein